MFVREVWNQEKPFAHPGMIGAYCVCSNGRLVHRDDTTDFLDRNWEQKFSTKSQHLWCLHNLVNDIDRDDWFIIEL